MSYGSAKVQYSAEELSIHSVSSEEDLFLRKPHIFDDPATAEYYKDLYDATEYECRHHFDPTFEWSQTEERRLVRRTDWRVTLWAFVMFVALDIDRGNISNALSGNMLDDLKLTTNDFNLGLTINLLCFLSAELPSQLISKRLGPDRWIPAQMVLWSLVAMAQMTISGRLGFFIYRGLVGLLQGSFIAVICVWMSFFYTGSELPMRLTLFYIANPLTKAFSSLLAYGIFHLDGAAGIAGWRWLFLLEGMFTLVIGAASFFMMPPSVVQTRTWFRPHGWYTKREELIMVNRILRDDPTKGDMHNREPLTLKLLVASLLEYDLWPVYLLRFLSDIGVGPVSMYLTLTLRNMGFSTLTTNLLAIPPSLISIFTMVSITMYSDRVDSRWKPLLIQTLWKLPFLFILRYWSGTLANVWGTYIVLVLVLSYPNVSALTITWCSSNAGSVRSRTVSAAMVNIFSQLGSVVASNIYREDDAPLYHRGNRNLIIIVVATALLCYGSKWYYDARNSRRERVWESMSAEQQQQYMRTTSDEGNSRLNFRFVH